MQYINRVKTPKDYGIPKWNDGEEKIRDFENYLDMLEERGVFFSYPMDLDFAMLLAYPEAYNVEEEKPDNATIKAVLGKSHYDSSQYRDDELVLLIPITNVLSSAVNPQLTLRR